MENNITIGKCKGKVRDSGRSCRIKILVDGEYCRVHTPDPDIRHKMIQTNKANGAKNSYIPQFKGLTIDDTKSLHKFVSMLLTAIAKGNIKTTISKSRAITEYGNLLMKTEERIKIIDRLDKLDPQD
jgi:hypothetical protein